MCVSTLSLWCVVCSEVELGHHVRLDQADRAGDEPPGVHCRARAVVAAGRDVLAGAVLHLGRWDHLARLAELVLVSFCLF